MASNTAPFLKRKVPLVFGKPLGEPIEVKEGEEAQTDSYALIMRDVWPENAALCLEEMEKVNRLNNEQGFTKSSCELVPLKRVRVKQTDEERKIKRRKRARENNQKPENKEKRRKKQQEPEALDKASKRKKDPINQIVARYQDRERRLAVTLLKQVHADLYQPFRDEAKKKLEKELNEKLDQKRKELEERNEQTNVSMTETTVMDLTEVSTEVDSVSESEANMTTE